MQVLAGQYKQRLTLIAADIGTDDVILGVDVLQSAQGGFGPSGFWRMIIDGQELLIPLIGEHSNSDGKAKTVRSKKKMLKLLVAHLHHVFVGKVTKVVMPPDLASDAPAPLASAGGNEAREAPTKMAAAGSDAASLTTAARAR